MSEKETLFYTTSDQIRTNPENSWENGDLTDLRQPRTHHSTGRAAWHM